MERKDKLLKPYKGFMIEKSWDEWKDGSKHDIVYTAYVDDGDGVYDGAKTLPELKKKIDRYQG